jgi:hypothetical protein
MNRKINEMCNWQKWYRNEGTNDYVNDATIFCPRIGEVVWINLSEASLYTFGVAAIRKREPGKSPPRRVLRKGCMWTYR